MGEDRIADGNNDDQIVKEELVSGLETRTPNYNLIRSGMKQSITAEPSISPSSPCSNSSSVLVTRSDPGYTRSWSPRDYPGFTLVTRSPDHEIDVLAAINLIKKQARKHTFV